MTHLKTALLSPLAILAVAPFYATWLLYQYMSQLPTSLATLRLSLSIYMLSVAIALPLSYVLIFTYGVFVKRALERTGTRGPIWFAIAGAVPGLLLLLTQYSWQESVAPGVLFGVTIALVYWRSAMRHASSGR